MKTSTYFPQNSLGIPVVIYFVFCILYKICKVQNLLCGVSAPSPATTITIAPGQSLLANSIRVQPGTTGKCFLFCRVADPDPYLDPDWIRIQSGKWIRIRIRNPDPDPGGKNDPQK